MPILVAGGISQLNASTRVILNGGQQAATRNSATSRRVYPAVPASALFLVNQRQATVADQGNNQWIVSKDTVTGDGFSTSAIGTLGFPGDFAFSVLRIATANSFFFAANSDPLTDDNYTGLDYSLALDFASSNWQVWESGSYTGISFSDSGATIPVHIWRTGTTIGYGVGADLATAQASPARTVAGVTSLLFFDSSIYDAVTSFSVQLSGTPVTLITGTAAFSFTPAGTMSGTGALTGASTLTFSPAATMTGKGALTGASTLTFSPSGTATGKGALVGASTVVFSPAAALTGSGALTGASSLTFAPTGTITGKGALTGTSPLTFTPAGTATGTGALSGASSLSFSTSGTASGTGALVGTASVAFAPAGTLSGIVYITGIASIEFSAVGTLIGIDLIAEMKRNRRRRRGAFSDYGIWRG